MTSHKNVVLPHHYLKTVIRFAVNCIHVQGKWSVETDLSIIYITISVTGYGDSSGSPSEDGVVADALFVYRWIKERKGKTPFFLWGHSLGTGYASWNVIKKQSYSYR